MMAERRGTPFERLVAAVQAKLDPGADVDHSEKVVDSDGVPREIDVTVRGRLGSARFFLAVEAKDYPDTPVGIELVEAFIAKVPSVGANKGIMVSSGGFTSGALKKAKGAGIDTCILRSAVPADWDGFIRAVEMQGTVLVPTWRDIVVSVEGGVDREVASARSVPLTVRDEGELFPLDAFLGGQAKKFPEMTSGKPFRFEVTDELWWHAPGDIRTRVLAVRARLDHRVLKPPPLYVESPHDAVFVRVTPEGEEIDEKEFFEFRELEQLAERFKKSPK